MEVLYHLRPYFEGIFPYIGLILYMVGTSNLGSWNGHGTYDWSWSIELIKITICVHPSTLIVQCHVWLPEGRCTHMICIYVHIPTNKAYIYIYMYIYIYISYCDILCIYICILTTCTCVCVNCQKITLSLHMYALSTTIPSQKGWLW